MRGSYGRAGDGGVVRVGVKADATEEPTGISTELHPCCPSMPDLYRITHLIIRAPIRVPDNRRPSQRVRTLPRKIHRADIKLQAFEPGHHVCAMPEVVPGELQRWRAEEVADVWVHRAPNAVERDEAMIHRAVFLGAGVFGVLEPQKSIQRHSSAQYSAEVGALDTHDGKHSEGGSGKVSDEHSSPSIPLKTTDAQMLQTFVSFKAGDVCFRGNVHRCAPVPHLSLKEGAFVPEEPALKRRCDAKVTPIVSRSSRFWTVLLNVNLESPAPGKLSPMASSVPNHTIIQMESSADPTLPPLPSPTDTFPVRTSLSTSISLPTFSAVERDNEVHVVIDAIPKLPDDVSRIRISVDPRLGRRDMASVAAGASLGGRSRSEGTGNVLYVRGEASRVQQVLEAIKNACLKKNYSIPDVSDCGDDKFPIRGTLVLVTTRSPGACGSEAGSGDMEYAFDLTQEDEGLSTVREALIDIAGPLAGTIAGSLMTTYGDTTTKGFAPLAQGGLTAVAQSIKVAWKFVHKKARSKSAPAPSAPRGRKGEQPPPYSIIPPYQRAQELPSEKAEKELAHFRPSASATALEIAKINFEAVKLFTAVKQAEEAAKKAKMAAKEAKEAREEAAKKAKMAAKEAKEAMMRQNRTRAMLIASALGGRYEIAASRLFRAAPSDIEIFLGLTEGVRKDWIDTMERCELRS
ncbi:hypothetical protein BDK51DRAFT_44582 [Blyttiomyces helicus]|uniref:Uncharacterized protein n=1 Tax=Blyttiomyces helicus TaxID=388810 RepID=A0A4P9WR92_9FUNG|nr:hypothetical protein BDK51DRAFT_44582 [Blyttiomyces helicus]|eukprot:RKO93760.1 hypothetical protein BDK51DRAFT_44582 [Blyttiomyces helicus]